MCWQCWADSPFGTDQTSAVGPLAADVVNATPQSASARFFLTPTGHAGVNGLFSAYAWSEGGTITFAFPDNASDYESFYGSSEPARGFAKIGSAMQDAIRKILMGAAAGVSTGPGSPGPGVMDFTNLTLMEAGNDSTADIRIARSTAPSTAWAYYPNGREGGDVWFGSRYSFDTPRLGSYQFVTAIHELGHALGLKHAHEVANGFAAVPAELDGMEFTVMSYRSAIGGSTTSGYTNGTYDYAQSWMMLDIAALQAMYGADYTYRAGDTRYAWDPATGQTFVDGIGQGLPGDGSAASNRIFLTLWDGGGVDCFDLSNYTSNLQVDLAPGGHSVLSQAQLATLDFRDGSKARGNVFNALLYEGNTASLIENAIGGTGHDSIAGNQAANALQGGAGQDSLDGRDGPDLLIGGAGADTLRGGAGFDSFVVHDNQDTVLEEPGAGLDQLRTETPTAIVLPIGVEILRLGEAGRWGIGNAGNNLLIGSTRADRLEGAGGADVIEGGDSADTLSGGSGADQFVLRRGDGQDCIQDFQSGADKLVLTGFGLSRDAVLASAVEVAGGVAIDLGGGDGVLLAGLLRSQIGASDFVL